MWLLKCVSKPFSAKVPLKGDTTTQKYWKTSTLAPFSHQYFPFPFIYCFILTKKRMSFILISHIKHFSFHTTRSYMSQNNNKHKKLLLFFLLCSLLLKRFFQYFSRLLIRHRKSSNIFISLSTSYNQSADDLGQRLMPLGI